MHTEDERQAFGAWERQAWDQRAAAYATSLGAAGRAGRLLRRDRRRNPADRCGARPGGSVCPGRRAGRYVALAPERYGFSDGTVLLPAAAVLVRAAKPVGD